MVARLLDLLVVQGFRRGRRGSPAWLAVGAGAWLWRRRRRPHHPVAVWSEELKPGESVVVTHLDPD